MKKQRAPLILGGKCRHWRYCPSYSRKSYICFVDEGANLGKACNLYSRFLKRRTPAKALFDTITFPFRAVAIFDRNRFGLTSLQSERFEYVSREVKGHCLDVGCGPHNRFVKEFLNGNGRGIDVYKYPGLSDIDIVKDPARLPFSSESFDTVTLIACINHIPESIRRAELAEISRVTKPGGKIIVTMGNPICEILVHKVISVYDRLFGTSHDVDGQRTMKEDESYYLRDSEIKSLLSDCGFRIIKKKRFWTQLGLNHLFVGIKA
jgi:SAM-dependent methyltransferase